MRLAKTLLGFAFLCAAQAAAAEQSFQGALERGAAAHPSPHPSQYSFADIYRAAVSAPLPALFAAAPPADAPIRVAAAQPAAQFSIGDAPEPRLGLLLLSGLALAVWVARRRLGYAF